MSSHSVLIFLRRLGKQGGVEKVKVHRFRHTFATWAIQNEARELDVQYLLGHSTPAMVRRYSATYDADKAARAAAHSRRTCLSAQYHRLAARRGGKRAVVAVAHTLLVIVYHLLKRGETYSELGGNYFDERGRWQVERRLVRRLEALGYAVCLQPAA